MLWIVSGDGISLCAATTSEKDVSRPLKVEANAQGEYIHNGEKKIVAQNIV